VVHVLYVGEMNLIQIEIEIGIAIEIENPWPDTKSWTFTALQ